MADQSTPAPAAAGTPKRKYVRMGGSLPPPCDLGAMGAFAALKAEADNMCRAGVAHVLAKVENLTPLLHNYLSGSVARVHSDEVGREHEAHNSKVYENVQATTNAYVGSRTGTCAVQMDKSVSLHTYISLVSALKTGTDDTDGVPKFHLDSVGGANDVKKPGGFQKLYDSVNVPALLMKKPHQDRCIFGMSQPHFLKVAGSPGKRLYDLVSKQVSDMYPEKSISCKAVHVLFHWNAHSFFTYHLDDDGDVSAIVNLSHGEASMHVAGCAKAVYDGIGSAHIFPHGVFHRSGDAPRRCVKVAFFFSLASVKKESESGGPTSTSADEVGAGEISSKGGSSSTPVDVEKPDTPAADQSDPANPPKSDTSKSDLTADEEEPPAKKQKTEFKVPDPPVKDQGQAAVAEDATVDVPDKPASEATATAATAPAAAPAARSSRRDGAAGGGKKKA